MSVKSLAHAANESLKHSIRKVTIISGGRMGAGLVQLAAQNAQKVVLVEMTQDSLKKSAEKIIVNLAESAREMYKSDQEVKKYIEHIMNFVIGTTNPVEAVKQADLVLEAISEDVEKKQELFKRIDKAASEKTIFATTTNSFSIGAFADKSSRVKRFVGLHFFYPILETKLVEVVKLSVTSKDTLDSVIDWCKNIGKNPVVCNDSAGFIVNRLLLSYITEAIRMMERADATAHDIDKAMKLATGSPMGPIQLADYMGHDTILKLVEMWRTREPENRLFTPCISQKNLVQRGMLGVKSGEGYYKYKDLKYWVTNFSHKIKNKNDWLKHYQMWKKSWDIQQQQSMKHS